MIKDATEKGGDETSGDPVAKQTCANRKAVVLEVATFFQVAAIVKKTRVIACP